ncbi:MAG: PorT family protein, partial [Tidjanibacter sp.]|nr:PorT family protein [Tidjanibacter sp.]
MKKVIMMVAVALMAITTVNAQSHRWFWIGAKAGLTSSASNVQMDGDGIQGVFDGAMGYNAGLMLRLNAPLGIFSIHLQPEIMYNWQKGQFNQTNGVQQEITLNEFSIPVLAGLGMDLGLFNARVQAGPVVKFNSNMAITGENANVAGINWNDVSYTWAAGVGIDLFNFLMVDFRYLGGWLVEPRNIAELFNFNNVNPETNTW